MVWKKRRRRGSKTVYIRHSYYLNKGFSRSYPYPRISKVRVANYGVSFFINYRSLTQTEYIAKIESLLVRVCAFIKPYYLTRKSKVVILKQPVLTVWFIFLDLQRVTNSNAHIFNLQSCIYFE